MSSQTAKKTSARNKEICLRVVTGKDGTFQNVAAFTAITSAIKGTTLGYDLVAQQIRDNGVFTDNADKECDVIYCKVSLKRATYRKKTGTK